MCGSMIPNWPTHTHRARGQRPANWGGGSRNVWEMSMIMSTFHDQHGCLKGRVANAANATPHCTDICGAPPNQRNYVMEGVATVDPH